MKTFQVEFRYQDRKNGPEGSTVKVDASSLPGAIAKATRTFVKGLDRKQRFDMNKNGLDIKAVCVDAEKESSTATDNTTTSGSHKAKRGFGVSKIGATLPTVSVDDIRRRLGRQGQSQPRQSKSAN